MTLPVTMKSTVDQTVQNDVEDQYLATLPNGFLPFVEFEKEFALGSTSTEQLHPITKSLSQVMHKSVSEGLGLLLSVDEGSAEGLERFIPSIETLAPLLAEKVRMGGRIFLVGSGSSGRMAVDIAAKTSLVFPQVDVRGIIAGGDSALIRAKEGFEDSETDGAAALKEAHLGLKDTVILISASGSASFNVGCGHFSADKGANVLYFYNSKNIPSRTQKLFERQMNPAIPLCIDVGPQAIAGSTRLQGATLAEACLGALLGSVCYLSQDKELLAKEYPIDVLAKMREGIALIRSHLESLEKFVKIEAEIFSDPRSNFKQLRDVSDQGYVTFVAPEESMREVLVDSTEASPTFSTNPIRRETENHKKRAEFRSYLLGQEENREAWKALLGRDVHPLDVKDTEDFLLACEAEGINSFQKRPKGKGNFVIGVVKLKEAQPLPEKLIHVLEAAKKEGGSIGLIVICNGKLKEGKELGDAVLILENVPQDALGIAETLVLKQTLNLISNGSMILMNKVHGNQMIDVRASNKKLIDRCIRLIKEIWSEYHPDFPLNDKVLYHFIAHVSAIKKSYEEKGIYTPSVVKIVLAMVSLKKIPENFQEVVEFLNKREERIDWIGEGRGFLWH